VVFSAWDNLALASSEFLRACSAVRQVPFSSVEALTAADRVDFSSDNASCVVVSCAARLQVNAIMN
jgi:hypothetical protein